LKKVLYNINTLRTNGKEGRKATQVQANVPDKGKPAERRGRKATDPTGKTEGGWVAGKR
jgi:hypothetical protein